MYNIVNELFISILTFNTVQMCISTYTFINNLYTANLDN